MFRHPVIHLFRHIPLVDRPEENSYDALATAHLYRRVESRSRVDRSVTALPWFLLSFSPGTHLDTFWLYVGKQTITRREDIRSDLYFLLLISLLEEIELLSLYYSYVLSRRGVENSYFLKLVFSRILWFYYYMYYVCSMYLYYLCIVLWFCI